MSKMTTVENKIRRLNVQMVDKLDRFISKLESLRQEELKLEDEVNRLADLEDMLEGLEQRNELSDEDRKKVLEIVETDREVFDRIDKAREEADNMEKRLEEIETKAKRVMEDLGGLSPKRTF